MIPGFWGFLALTGQVAGLGGLIGFLVYLMVLIGVCYLLFWFLTRLKLPPPVVLVITLVVALVILVYLLRMTGLVAL